MHVLSTAPNKCLSFMDPKFSIPLMGNPSGLRKHHISPEQMKTWSPSWQRNPKIHRLAAEKSPASPPLIALRSNLRVSNCYTGRRCKANPQHDGAAQGRNRVRPLVGLKLNSLRLLKDDPVHSSATTGRAWLLYKYDAKVQNKASLLSEMLF
jgi:hypothetical protein